MSRYLIETDIRAIQNLLSSERLATFQKLTKSGSPEDAIELHQATMSLGVSIMAVTGLIEVSLRNAVCGNMDSYFDGSPWLRTPPPNSFRWAYLETSSITKAVAQAQRAAYSKMSDEQKKSLDAKAYPQGVPENSKHRTVTQERQKTISVPDSQVIAQLTIHFWKRMFSESTNRPSGSQFSSLCFPTKPFSAQTSPAIWK